MKKTLVNAATSFVEVAPKDFKSDYLTGPQGYQTILYNTREAVAKSLGEADKAELAGAFSMAAMANYQALATHLGSTYPALKGRVQFGLNSGSGAFVHPKGAMSPTEQAILKKYNQAFNGKQVIELITEFTGAKPNEAVTLFGSSYGQYKARQTTTTPRTQAPAKPSEGGQGSSGAWWKRDLK